MLREGKNIVLCSTGSIMQEVNKVAALLEEKGINVGVINFHTIKPFDNELVLSSMKQY